MEQGIEKRVIVIKFKLCADGLLPNKDEQGLELSGGMYLFIRHYSFEGVKKGYHHNNPFSAG